MAMTDETWAASAASPSRAKSYFQIVTVAAVLAFVGLFAWSLQLSSAGQLRSGLAPDFTLTPFDGAPVRLSDLRGKVVVLNIWASWCVPCRDEAPILESTWRAYQDKGVVILGADYVDTEPAARAFIKEFDVTYPNGPDLGSNIYRLFRARGVPETYFIDQRGNIVNTVIGPITEPVMQSTLAQLLEPGR